MLVFDLASRKARELAPGLAIDPRSDGWSPLDAAPGGESVYLMSNAGNTRWLVEAPRKPGRKPRALLSFPDAAMPVGIALARDGSMYLDLLQNQFVLLRVNASGGPVRSLGYRRTSS